MCESKIATRKSTYKFTKVYMNLAEKQWKINWKYKIQKTMTFVSKSKQSYSCVKVLQDHFKSTTFFSDKSILFYWESQRLMKEINVKLNGYICACHNLKLDVRIILSYNFTVIEKSTHRSMPTHILKIHTSKYATKKPPKTHTKNLLRHVF